MRVIVRENGLVGVVMSCVKWEFECKGRQHWEREKEHGTRESGENGPMPIQPTRSSLETIG